MMRMSVAELKEIVDKSTEEERIFLEAYLQHLNRVADPENGRDLDERLGQMDAANKVSLTKAFEMHQALKARGQ